MTRLSDAAIESLERQLKGARNGMMRVSADDIAAMIAELRERRAAETQPPNTAKVRIAVAVNADGEWSADGADSWQDGYAINAAKAAVADDSRVTFVTAYAPLPEPPAEVAGSVEVGDV